MCNNVATLYTCWKVFVCFQSQCLYSSLRKILRSLWQGIRVLVLGYKKKDWCGKIQILGQILPSTTRENLAQRWQCSPWSGEVFGGGGGGGGGLGQWKDERKFKRQFPPGWKESQFNSLPFGQAVATTSCKNVETLPRKNALSCFKSLLVTGL